MFFAQNGCGSGFKPHDPMVSEINACLSETDKPSATLTAMNFSKEDAYAGVRLSFSTQNTMHHAEIFINKFQQALLNY